MRGRRVLVALAGLLVAIGISACSVPGPKRSLCRPAKADVLDEISTKLDAKGWLRRGYVYTVKGGGPKFVSAELHLNADKITTDGTILTWVEDPDRQFLAVDERARQYSGWPGAPFDVREQGARESRGCVYDRRTDDDDKANE
jgi:hypothetical protein